MKFEELDAAYLSVAGIVERHGEEFLPVFELLADARENALKRRSQLQEALARLPEKERKRRARSA
jgi:hypothetical protein